MTVRLYNAIFVFTNRTANLTQDEIKQLSAVLLQKKLI